MLHRARYRAANEGLVVRLDRAFQRVHIKLRKDLDDVRRFQKILEVFLVLQVILQHLLVIGLAHVARINEQKCNLSR